MQVIAVVQIVFTQVFHTVANHVPFLNLKYWDALCIPNHNIDMLPINLIRCLCPFFFKCYL